MSNGLGAGKSGGSLSDIMNGLNQMLGGTQTRQYPQTGGGGGLGDILSSLANNKAALGGLGALAGALLGGGKSSAKGAVGGGGLAMLASLAMSALQKSGQSPQETPRALLEPQTTGEQSALEQEAEIIVKAMINAAKADGEIDEAEIQRILGKLAQDGLTEEERELFVQEARKPMNITEVVASADGQPQMAAQIYAASLLAIEVDTPAEERYMQQLAAGLGLGQQVTAHIENSLGM
ncbi:tellurite resistance TerB family protein [Desulfosediminicola sp.]|uniref:tellurite resistance TerB family protein n=1 Tax=Desulfosediminicola sp. TaxID=2886825 RepID=UPI003AF276DE